MNVKDTCTVLETLLDGVNPVTGELLPEDHVCQEPVVLRALHKALVALRSGDAMPADDGVRVNRNGRLDAGRPWTQGDLDRLKQLHVAGTSMEEMCHLLQRRRRGIERQLAYLGLMNRSEQRTAAANTRSRAGTPWLAEEDRRLWELWRRGVPGAQIAKELQRSAYAIQCRMERLGMLASGEEAQPVLPPWVPSDEQQLKRMHAEGCTAEEIAAVMDRPVESIHARMFYMGLTREAPISLHGDENQ